MPFNRCPNSQIGQIRSVRCYLLSHERTRAFNDTTKLPKACLQFGHYNSRQSWRDICWETTYTKHSFLLLQTYCFSLWAPHGKSSKCTLHCIGVFSACPLQSPFHHTPSVTAAATPLCQTTPSTSAGTFVWPKHIWTAVSSGPNLGPASCALLTNPLYSFKPEATPKP